MIDHNKQITVTSPLLPDLNDYHEMLKQIWDKRHITNNGDFHKQLEEELAKYLGVEHISLFTNGTLPLIVALQALEIKGEVITTPYTFAATAHSIVWNNLTPVFVDVDPNSCNIDPDKIEAAITPNTTAIMPVHCYGNPCNTDAIQKIATRHNLKVVYDAAHAFGVKTNGTSILSHGDLATLSFHATKVFNTVEGGAIICSSKEMKQKINKLRNFGFCSETEIEGVGINGKMDELRAAFGLLNLRNIDNAIAQRRKIAQRYSNALNNIEGIDCLRFPENIEHNYSHFPIFIDELKYGISRDKLYQKLKENNILSRRYFYPLITAFQPYSNLASANPKNLPIANKLANSVICLPIYPHLSEYDQQRIIELINNK